MYKLILVLYSIVMILACNSSSESKEAMQDSIAKGIEISDTTAAVIYDERYPPDTTGVGSDTLKILKFKIHLRSHINYITNMVSSVNENGLQPYERKILYRRLRSTLGTIYDHLSMDINKSLLGLVKQNTTSLASINGQLEEKNDELKNYADTIKKIANVLGFFADAATNLVGLRAQVIKPAVAATETAQ